MFQATLPISGESKDAADVGSAFLLEVEWNENWKPQIGMDGPANDFVNWHSADRWEETEGCWHAGEGRFEEVEFQAKCVETSKLFVHIKLPLLIGDVYDVDILAMVDLAEQLGLIGGPVQMDGKDLENQQQAS